MLVVVVVLMTTVVDMNMLAVAKANRGVVMVVGLKVDISNGVLLVLEVDAVIPIK